MKSQPSSNASGAPMNPPSTERTVYQSRVGVSPTRTPELSFQSSEENGLWQRFQGRVEPYSPINGREPNSIEKGTGSPAETSSNHGPR